MILFLWTYHRMFETPGRPKGAHTACGCRDGAMADEERKPCFELAIQNVVSWLNSKTLRLTRFAFQGKRIVECPITQVLSRSENDMMCAYEPEVLPIGHVWCFFVASS